MSSFIRVLPVSFGGGAWVQGPPVVGHKDKAGASWLWMQRLGCKGLGFNARSWSAGFGEFRA